MCQLARSNPQPTDCDSTASPSRYSLKFGYYHGYWLLVKGAIRLWERLLQVAGATVVGFLRNTLTCFG